MWTFYTKLWHPKSKYFYNCQTILAKFGILLIQLDFNLLIYILAALQLEASRDTWGGVSWIPKPFFLKFRKASPLLINQAELNLQFKLKHYISI